MSNFLTNYELTNEGQALGAINIPPNDMGDEGMYFRVAKLTDRQAALLASRKDGRGARFVKKKGNSSVKK